MADASTLAPAPAPPHNGRLRLRTLVLIRWIALIGQTTTLAVVYFGLGYAIPFVPAMAVIAASGALNVVISIARPTAIWISDREALWNLCFDLVLLAALLCLTGGLQNPFSILILAPVVISGWALSRRSPLILLTLEVALVIGRPPCRERVSQAVLISVVAVPLQKQKTTQTRKNANA